MILNDQAKRALAMAPADVVVYDTLELTHSLFDIGLVSGYESVVIDGRSFDPYAFDVTVPGYASGAAMELQAVISNVRRSIPTLLLNALETLEPVKVFFRQYIVGGGLDATIEPGVPMNLLSAVEQGDHILIRAGHVNLLDALFLHQRYTTDRFPGLSWFVSPPV